MTSQRTSWRFRGNVGMTSQRIIGVLRATGTGHRGVGWALWLALLPIASTRPLTSGAALDPPQALFKDLFIAVQTAQIYPDGKAFPDAIPNASPNDILKQYHAE